MILLLALLNIYLCAVFFVLGLIPPQKDARPSLGDLGITLEDPRAKKKKKGFNLFRLLAGINTPICKGVLRKRITRDLQIGHVNMSPEEFILIKELVIVLIIVLFFPMVEPDMLPFLILMGFAGGYMIPEFWLKGRIKAVKAVIVKELPDAIDLLGLCVNAGLDFMLSLKWVVEKSPPSIMISELNTVLQEINVGKTRRDAIRDLAARYELPDLSTFARTLIQADKMGTSVTDALNILSEDMRLARYRRGEQLAMKAPMKMLVPLLVFIFPVVGILVAGPIFLDFIENKPFQSVGR